MTTDEGGTRTRTGDLSIAVSSPEGQVFGGPVGGALVAATTVQVLLFRLLIFFVLILATICSGVSLGCRIVPKKIRV